MGMLLGFDAIDQNCQNFCSSFTLKICFGVISDFSLTYPSTHEIFL
jgi:hypothetical protein